MHIVVVFTENISAEQVNPELAWTGYFSVDTCPLIVYQEALTTATFFSPVSQCIIVIIL